QLMRGVELGAAFRRDRRPVRRVDHMARRGAGPDGREAGIARHHRVAHESGTSPDPESHGCDGGRAQQPDRDGGIRPGPHVATVPADRYT
ncbi:MAG: hypothetical protein QOG65_182, partial [Actinomycetota bacterium]|nr:hypothetical protein [Actinomycetota bacterium]